MKCRPAQIFIFLICLFPVFSQSAQAGVAFSEDEIEIILSHGPWPLATTKDETNRFSGDDDAIKLGEKLFFDPALSTPADFSCASCHDPDLNFTDGQPIAAAMDIGSRNTPSIFNSRFQHWYGWAGSVDTLCGASLRAILNPVEMAGSADTIAAYIDRTPSLKDPVQEIVGASWRDASDPDKLVYTAKILAAYVETLVSKPSDFDHFRDALKSNNIEKINAYPDSAKRGLKIFVGEGNCSLCHFGSLFTNLDFSDIGIPHFIKPGIVDKGRYQGIKELKSSPYSSLSSYSDDQTEKSSILARHVTLRHQNWGEFKVPSLRSVSKTPPYMHNGSLDTLKDVINHYSELDEERLHTDGVAILRPLHLTDAQKSDLLTFLKSL